MKNNIKKILEAKGISVNKLSEMIDKDYPTTHSLVNRDSLENTLLSTLVDVAKVLDVNIEMLYGDSEIEIEILKQIRTGYIGGVAYHARDILEKMLEKEFNKKGIECDIQIKYSLELDPRVKDELIIKMMYYYNDDADIVLQFKTDSMSMILKSRFINTVSETLKKIELTEESIKREFNFDENYRAWSTVDLVSFYIHK